MSGHFDTFAPAMALYQADAALGEGLDKLETHPPTPRGVAQAGCAHRSATSSSWRGGLFRVSWWLRDWARV